MSYFKKIMNKLGIKKENENSLPKGENSSDETLKKEQLPFQEPIKTLDEVGSYPNVSIGLIFIDNYDEIYDSIEEIKRPLMFALIDRKIHALASQVGGIAMGFEKEKYLIMFSSNKLKVFQTNRFEILKNVREINMGNKFPVTLSIGIGFDGDTLAKNMQYARAAIDLSLGRGGDQAIVKNNDKYYFFGGIAKERGTNTRVRARVKAFAISELVAESSNILVIGHRNADLDCLGAALGVYKIAENYSKTCRIVLGDITTNIKQLHERIIVEARYGEDIFIKKEFIKNYVNPATLIVVVDAHKYSILEYSEIFKNEQLNKVVVIDHHRRGAEFIEEAVLVYHEPSASSTCELITEMLQYLRNQVRFEPVEADALLAGITVDTKNFTIKTGAKTFEAAAFLKRNGADSVRVKLLFQNNFEAFKAKSETVNSAEVFKENMAVSTCPSNIENPQLTAAQAADELLNISGIEASFVISTFEEKIFISARSLGDINVQLIMEKLGGGGHQTVAGAQFETSTEDEVLIVLKDAINKYINEN